MNDFESAKRLTAWTWAAETLGVEASPERLSGLVMVTERVRIENLRPALEVVIQTEPRGFLPSPGAVIAAANRIADRKRSGSQQISSGGEMNPEQNRRWHEEHNPERWNIDQWRAYKTLNERGGAYATEVRRLISLRHEWAAEQVANDIRGRHVSMRLRIKMRRDYNNDARLKFPAPEPVAALEALSAYSSAPHIEADELTREYR